MEFFERAVELDPGYVWAWVRLAWTHVIAARAGSPSESIKKVVAISKKVLVLDESDSDVHALLGLVGMNRLSLKGKNPSRSVQPMLKHMSFWRFP